MVGLVFPPCLRERKKVPMTRSLCTVEKMDMLFHTYEQGLGL